MTAISALSRRPAFAVALALAALTIFRIVLVAATPLELNPDEAQYWRWSRTLDFGYYSKPPMIAWTIAATTAAFGNAEWAIRLGAPILHSLGAWVLFLLGRRMFDARVGAWAAALYALMLAVWLSSCLISTDVVLLPTWALALLMLWRLRETPSVLAGALAGAAIGLTVLAKYAGLYLFAGLALAVLADRPMRAAMLAPAGAALAAATLLVVSPNIWWNVVNNFATVAHTAENADLDHAAMNPLRAFNFLIDQMGVAGPVLIILLAAGGVWLVGRKDKERTSREIWLIAFMLPPLGVILVQSIISRAHANWAATAYPSACVLAASWVDRSFGRSGKGLRVATLLKANVGVSLAAGAVFAALWLSPSLADSVSAGGAMKTVRGWKQTADQLSKRAADVGASAIIVDDRELWHGLDYYGPGRGLPPLRTWRRWWDPRNYAEEYGAIRPGDDRNALVVSMTPGIRPMIREDFAEIREVGYLVIPLGPRQRKLKLYLASGYHQQPRTAAYEARHASDRED